MIVAQAQPAEQESGFERVLTNIVDVALDIGAFLLILIVGFIVAKVLARVLDRVLDRVGFNGWVERGGVKTALDRTKYDAADILSRIVFWVVMLFVLQLAFRVFGPNPISALLTGLIAFLPKLFVALVIIVITAAVASGVRNIIQGALGGLNYGRYVAVAAMVLIWFVGMSAALNQIEIAPEIINGLFYAVLALIVGVAIVAIGGGGILPMRQRWERALTRAEAEAPQIKRQAQQRQTVDVREAPSPAMAGPGPTGGQPYPPGQPAPQQPGQPTEQYPPQPAPPERR